LNTTLGLALISLVATHALAIQSTGIKEYIGRYLSINPIYLYVESWNSWENLRNSLRFLSSFGIYSRERSFEQNGELFAFFVPIPFILLELIVVGSSTCFAMLTMAFMSVLMTPHHAEAKEHV